MRENISNLNTLTEIHSNTLEDNEKNLAKLNEEIPKLNKLEEELKQSKDKTKSKFRKTKLKIQTISLVYLVTRFPFGQTEIIDCPLLLSFGNRCPNFYLS